MEKFDVTVIGAGPGGYPAAIRAAQLGAKVAVVEKEALGGTCLNWGCIPTKTLIAGACLYDHLRHASDFGVTAGTPGFDYKAMADRKNAVVSRLGNGIGQLLKANGVRVFNGTASFVARNRIRVAPASAETAETMIETAGTLIATGSASVMPGFLPKHARVLDSRAFLELTRLPASLIVLGGGVIGCEFACMAAQLGVQVTIVELLEDILMVLDPDVRRELRRHMEKTLKIRVLTGKPLANIQAEAGGVSGTFGDETVKAELLLASLGRRPVTTGMNLESVGVSLENGGIQIDACGRTSAATIYAIGDVTAGSTQLAHAATSQGVLAAENLYLGKRKTFETVVPACVFTAPEVGSVGLTEQKAKETGRAVKIGKYAFAGLGKAMAAGDTTGFVKWIADAQTDRLLGAQAVGPHATELISEAATAVRNELTAAELGNTIHCHPSLSEAWMEAAHAVHETCIHAPPARRRA